MGHLKVNWWPSEGSIISLEGHLNAHTVVENNVHSEGNANLFCVMAAAYPLSRQRDECRTGQCQVDGEITAAKPTVGKLR